MHDSIVFLSSADIGTVTISPSQPNTAMAGENLTLECSTTIDPLPENLTCPIIDWLFNEENISPPYSLTPMESRNGITYTSTLQFSPLSQSHAGMYTCRFGGNERLAANVTVTVNGITLFNCHN